MAPQSALLTDIQPDVIDWTHPAFAEDEFDIINFALGAAGDELSLSDPPPDLDPLTLPQFIRAAWHVVEPAIPFVDNWHIDAMCDYLMACSRYEIKKLVINIPPGHMKSLLACVMWPAFLWGEVDPSLRFIFSSYDMSLSVRDSLKTRYVIESPWYEARYGHQVKAKRDNWGKKLFENTMTGFRMATSPGASGTGNRGHFVVTDDVIKASDVLSETKREYANNWWTKEMNTRTIDKNIGCHICIGQRLHTKDLPAICKENGYEMLILPAEYDPHLHFFSTIGFTDPRAEEGELLFEERYDQAYLDEQKISLGSYQYSAQFQQKPVPQEGGIINTDWFLYKSVIPDNPQGVVFSIDTANKKKNLNAFHALGVWYVYKNFYVLAHVWRDRCNQPDLKRRVKELALHYKPNTVLIEDKASGTGLIQYLEEETKLNIIPIIPKGEKLARITSESPAIEAGRVYLLEDQYWIGEYILELGSLPLVDYLDQTDMTSQFLQWAREHGFKTGYARW